MIISNGHVYDISCSVHLDCESFDTTVLSGATVLAATGNSQTPGSGVTNYAFENDLSVVYEGTDSNIYLINFDTVDGWSVSNLSALAGAPAAEAGSSLANIFNLGENNQAYIYYFGTDLHIHELTKNPSGAWVTKDETVAAGAPNAAANSPMVTLLFDGDFFVHYLTSAGHVQEIYASANPSSGTWHTRDLTRLSGAPNAFMGGGSVGPFPSTLANSGDQHEHVFFFTADAHLHEIYSFGNGSFATDDATLQTGAPEAAEELLSLTSFALSNQIYVLYPFLPIDESTISTAFLQGPENDMWTLSETPAGSNSGGGPMTSTYNSSSGQETVFFDGQSGFEFLLVGNGCTVDCLDLTEFQGSLVGLQMASTFWQ
jgi:hypothetical protein